MSDCEFTVDGLEDFINDFNKIVKEYPDAAEKELYRQAGKWSEDVNEKMPESYEKSGLKKWKRSRIRDFSGHTLEIDVANKASHWHLIENGHELYINPTQYAILMKDEGTSTSGHKRKHRSRGRKGMIHAGFVPGKHYAEKTRKEWQSIYPERIKKFIDKMLKDHNL